MAPTYARAKTIKNSSYSGKSVYCVAFSGLIFFFFSPFFAHFGPIPFEILSGVFKIRLQRRQRLVGSAEVIFVNYVNCL